MDTLIYTQSSERIPIVQKDFDPSTTLAVHTDLGATLTTLQANTFQKITIELASLSEFNKDTLNQLYNVLKPDGVLNIQHAPELSQDVAHLKDAYIIAGFKEDSVDSSNLVLKKPSWAGGKGVATLKKKGGAVKIDAGDDVEKKANPFAKFAAQETNNKELINEDNLLENETEYNPLGKDESCSTKPKACANCSCGRAELEAMEEAGISVEKKIENGKVESSCGSCYLGDAFRCASCPYKGLPAFKPGDKVKLDLSKDGLGGVLKEDNDVVVSNGKVKLQI